MLELVQFPRALGVMNASPFCMKVEVFLKLAGLPYQVDDKTLPMRLPKGKLPGLRDGGTVVCDSQAIVEYLQQRYRDQLPAALRNPEQGTDRALRLMLEEHLYFAMLWHRWIADTGFTQAIPALFTGLPAPLRAVLPHVVRRKMRRDLLGQGMGRHSPQEIADHACGDLTALQSALGEKAFFGGANPSSLDAVAYAFLANIVFVAVDNPVRRHLQAQAGLLAYCARMEALVGR